LRGFLAGTGAPVLATREEEVDFALAGLSVFVGLSIFVDDLPTFSFDGGFDLVLALDLAPDDSPST